LKSFFEDGKHLVLYRSLDEMVDKAKYYIEHDEEREKIAQAGYEHVIANHTIQHRVNVILNEFMKSRVPALA
jgi:spore maturation protein CgeB